MIEFEDAKQVNLNVKISGKIGSGMDVKAGNNNDPSTLRFVQDFLSNRYQDQAGFKGLLRLPVYDEDRAMQGFLKTAFLYLFAKFGYSYALSGPGRHVVRRFVEGSGFKIVMLKPFSGYEDSILLSQRSGLCFVGFSEFALVCPWVNADVAKYDQACEKPQVFLGTYKELLPFAAPRKFEAILDFM